MVNEALNYARTPALTGGVVLSSNISPLAGLYALLEFRPRATCVTRSASS
ncbi:MAG: hypothetical protein WKG07_37520 [Hymenobacter sp.]